MSLHRRVVLAVSFVVMCLSFCDYCAAQENPALNRSNSGANSTANAPAPVAGVPGLIFFGRDSQVYMPLVQSSSQPMSQPTKSSSAAKTNNTLSAEDSSIQEFGKYANDQSLSFSQRAGAIDALGILGGGVDDATGQSIVKELEKVLKTEFISADPADTAAPALPAGAKATPPIASQKKEALTYRNQNSESLCFHVVQAAAKVGWGARRILPEMQLLRGTNTILDSEIDRALSAMQTSPPASQTASTNSSQGSGAKNAAPAGP